ncbi:MAG: hypothetical protein V1692_00670 [bacterium]
MGEYANVKRNKVLRLLRWLEASKDIEIIEGGKHTYIVKYVFWDRPYPMPFKHNEINRHIIKSLMEKLVAAGICTKEEFDEHIK